jgi:protocatechuate 3,4-dioxygenase beta subunit
MAITDINVTGYVFKGDGNPLEGATVELLETGTTGVEDTYSGGTTAAGLWTFTETSLDTTYDVRISDGNRL